MTKQVELPKPLFWYRPIGKDGLYEGPTHSASVGGKMWREEKPDEWEGLFTADQMRQFREEGVQKALKYASDMARMHELGTPEGHEIADAIDEYAQSQAKGE